MKHLFVILLSVLFFQSNAQNLKNPALFQKGAELEYRTYYPKTGAFQKGSLEITRLTFLVTDVKDSNNILYSYVTKTGVNPLDDKLKFEKKYILTSDKNQINIPFDFFSPDTIYFSNMYPNTKQKGYYSLVLFKKNSQYQFPLNFEMGKFDLSEKRILMNLKVRDYETRIKQNGESESTGILNENSFNLDLEIKNIETKGKENIKTAAGSFPCYKINFTSGPASEGNNQILKYSLYYNTEIGLIKTVTLQYGKEVYTELASIKNN